VVENVGLKVGISLITHSIPEIECTFGLHMGGVYQGLGVKEIETFNATFLRKS